MVLAAVAVAATAFFSNGTIGWPDPVVSRSVAVAAVLALGVLPRLSIWMGGLAPADFLLRTSRESSTAETARRMAVARTRVVGAAAGVGVLATVAGVCLAVAGAAVDHLFVALLGLCLLVRSRLFRQTWGGAFLVAAGAVVVLVLGVLRVIVDPPPGLSWLAPLAAAVIAGLLLAAIQSRSASAGGEAGATMARRVLHWTGSTAVIAMLCLAVSAFGLWGFVAGLAA